MDLKNTPELKGLCIQMIENLNLEYSASILLIGGSDIFLLHYLLSKGFQNITVLDSYISEQRIKVNELGHNATSINWVYSKISEFKPDRKYDLWFDTTTFYLCTNIKDVPCHFPLLFRVSPGPGATKH